jgi:hypothetical protein
MPSMAVISPIMTPETRRASMTAIRRYKVIRCGDVNSTRIGRRLGFSGAYGRGKSWTRAVSPPDSWVNDIKPPGVLWGKHRRRPL